MLHAVLTGDIVNSTRLSAGVVSDAFSRMDDTVQQVRSWEDGVAVQFERYRGDGWQLYLDEARFGVRVAVLLRAACIAAGADTRLAIGIGSASAATFENPGTADGPAFRLSGRGLEQLGKHQRMGIFLEGHDTRLAESATALLDTLMSRWTARQAEVVALSLARPSPSQAEIGEKLSIGQSSVFKHYHAAGGSAVELALEAFEAVLG